MSGFSTMLLTFSVMACFALSTDLDLTDPATRMGHLQLNQKVQSTMYKLNSGTSGCPCDFHRDGYREFTNDVMIHKDGIIALRPSVEENNSSKECCSACYNTAKDISDILKTFKGDGEYVVVIKSRNFHYILCSNIAGEFILMPVEIEENSYQPSIVPVHIQTYAWSEFIEKPFSIKTEPMAKLSMELKSVKENMTILKAEESFPMEMEFIFKCNSSSPRESETDEYEFIERETAPTG